MSSTTSDKVGGVACLVLAIIAAIIALWPSLGGKKSASGKNKPAPGQLPAGPVNTANAPPPPAAPQGSANATGTQALAAMPVNGDSTPPQQAPQAVATPTPGPDPAAVIVRLLGDDPTIII